LHYDLNKEQTIKEQTVSGTTNNRLSMLTMLQQLMGKVNDFRPIEFSEGTRFHTHSDKQALVDQRMFGLEQKVFEYDRRARICELAAHQRNLHNVYNDGVPHR
jgi:hypothetical protein